MLVALARLVIAAKETWATTVRVGAATGVRRACERVEQRPVTADDIVCLTWALHYPLHARAFHRHAKWAREFASAGDLAAAMEALLDFEALAGELHDDGWRERHGSELR